MEKSRRLIRIINQSFYIMRYNMNSMNKRTLRISLAFLLVVAVSSTGVIVLNPGCRQFNNAGNCVACSTRFFKDTEGICQPVNPNCRTYNEENGACTSCYDGFSIVQNVCLPAPDQQMFALAAQFANCNQIGDNGKCKKCSMGFYFDNQKICKKIPDTCANFDINRKQCLGCYPGYSLNAVKQCQLSQSTTMDPGCSKFDSNNVCVKCSKGFYFGQNRLCKLIPPTCLNFDTFVQKCSQCYPGYTLDTAFNCVQQAPAAMDLGCAKFQQGKCSKCSNGFYFDRNNKCKIIPSTCSSFDPSLQICTGCYPGYSLDKTNSCVQRTTVELDAGCSKFQNGKCTRCSFGYYFGKGQKCKQIPAQCGAFDNVKQICTACYPGYSLDQDNKCVVSIDVISQPGCNRFQNGKCVKCSFGYYFNKMQACKLIPPVCSSFDPVLQACKACYPGFSINQKGQCVQSVATVSDLGCAKFQTGKCVKCSFGYYFNQNKVCKIIPPTCSDFDPSNEVCRGCYPGYLLDASKNCIKSLVTAVEDLGCSKFDKDNRCLTCSVGYYFNYAGKCSQIPTYCSNFDTVVALCKSCYPGYQLDIKNQCVLKQSTALSDPNCRLFKNDRCVQCSTGSYFDETGKCISYDPICKKFNSSTRKCEECYPGFTVDPLRSVCIQKISTVTDPNCKSFKNNQCIECSFRYYKDTDGKCKSIDPSCRLYNSVTGECTGCYDGYKLSSTKKCERDVATVSDSNCAEWKSNACVKCAFGSYFGPNGICLNVDPLCLTWNQLNGNCKTCYPSFQLNNGKCIVSTKQSFDPNCAQFNKNNECSKCSKGYYFGANNACTQVDPLCSTFDSKFGRCLTCYPGYKVNNGKCIQDIQALSDLGCANFKAGECVQCSFGFYFNQNGQCRPMSPQCRFFNQEKKRCGDCYPGYVLFNGECVVSNKDNLCAEWKQAICLRCVNRAYFNDQGGCSQVNQYCNDFDVFDGSCLSCYGGFSLIAGECKRQTESNGCVQYSKQSKCLKCQKRRYLQFGVCVKVDDLCDQFNYIRKECERCYSGYTLINGKCAIAEIKSESQIPNCFTYSAKGSCIECFDRYYMNNNSCKEVNVFCKKYHQGTGQCTDCYTGFRLGNGKCVRK